MGAGGRTLPLQILADELTHLNQGRKIRPNKLLAPTDFLDLPTGLKTGQAGVEVLKGGV